MQMDFRYARLLLLIRKKIPEIKIERVDKILIIVSNII